MKIRVVASIPETSHVGIMASIYESKGELTIDLRKYLESDGIFKPLEYGFRFDVKDLAAFQRMLELVKDEVLFIKESRGMN